MKKITIIITEDHKMVRESLSAVFNSDQRFTVIAQCNNGEEAVDKCRALRPDVVIMDINLPGINGMEASLLIKQQAPLTKIIGMSMHSSPAYVKQMMKAGVLGYVTKNSPTDELLLAVTEVINNRKYICEEVKNILSVDILERDDSSKPAELSPRESGIIDLMKKGFTSKEMATQLDLSVKTIEVHRYNIMKKLKLPNVAAVVNYANMQLA